MDRVKKIEKQMTSIHHPPPNIIQLFQERVGSVLDGIPNAHSTTQSPMMNMKRI
jgi:hypothetical protein